MRFSVGLHLLLGVIAIMNIATAFRFLLTAKVLIVIVWLLLSLEFKVNLLLAKAWILSHRFMISIADSWHLNIVLGSTSLLQAWRSISSRSFGWSLSILFFRWWLFDFDRWVKFLFFLFFIIFFFEFVSHLLHHVAHIFISLIPILFNTLFFLCFCHKFSFFSEAPTTSATDEERKNARSNNDGNRFILASCAFLVIDSSLSLRSWWGKPQTIARVAVLSLHSEWMVRWSTPFTSESLWVKEFIILAGGHQIQSLLRGELESSVVSSLTDADRVTCILNLALFIFTHFPNSDIMLEESLWIRIFLHDDRVDPAPRGHEQLHHATVLLISSKVDWVVRPGIVVRFDKIKFVIEEWNLRRATITTRHNEVVDTCQYFDNVAIKFVCNLKYIE